MKSKSIITILIIVITTTLIISCEKDISVDMPSPVNKLIVEGIIEVDEYPIVFLTKNAAYFDVVDTAVVNNSIVFGNDAQVIVSDGIIYDTLIPYTFTKWPYRGYYGTKIKGEINGTYSLKIIYQDKEYTSSTYIPTPIPIDSVWFNKFDGTDSLGFLNVNFMDPIENGNYYALLTKVDNFQEWFYRPYFGYHITDDKLGNGLEFSFSPISKGYERNSFFNNFSDGTEDIFKQVGFSIGDTVSVKLSTLDQVSYNIWSSWYSHQATNGNPFTNPATVLTNIEGAPSNGFWMGYGSHVTRVYIKDSVNLEILP